MSDMCTRIRGYYHICAINNYLPIVVAQLRRLATTGLMVACEHISVSLLAPTELAKVSVEMLIDQYNAQFPSPKIHIVFSSDTVGLYERPILNCMRQDALHSDAGATSVFYIHTKGVSNHHQTPKMRTRMEEWRRFMELCIDGWRDCVGCLSDPYSYVVCGVNYQDAPTPHFSGNMWWARMSYIKELKELPLEGDYSEPEKWVCSGYALAESPSKAWCFRHSNINHYTDDYIPPSDIKLLLPTTSPRVAIYTAIYGRYDPFQTPTPQTIPTDFFYFSDELHTTVATKDNNSGRGLPLSTIVRTVDRPDTIGPAMKAKYLRVHPFEIPELATYDIIIYLDGNIKIGTPHFVEDLLKVNKVGNYPLTISKHPETSCAYLEAYHAAKFPKYKDTDLVRQVFDYEMDGFPHMYGFHCSGFLVWNRRYIDELQTFQNMWWEQICKYNKTPSAFPECQISLMYCLWKTRMRVLKLKQMCFTSTLMIMTYHSR